MIKILFSRKHREVQERERRENSELLAWAENAANDLEERRVKATERIDERKRRNHWREGIQEMIQGLA